MAYKGKIEYQRAKGRAALPVQEWIKRNLIDLGVLTLEEFPIVPMWAILQFDRRLYQALMDSKRKKPR